MLPDWVLKYIGGGFAVVVGYVLISNTLWLLFGSRILQFLPGVNVNTASGTFKIAVMLVMSLTGLLHWSLKWPFMWMKVTKRASLKETISFYIQQASKIHSKVINNRK